MKNLENQGFLENLYLSPEAFVHFCAYSVDTAHREELSLKVSSKLEVRKNPERHFTEDTFFDDPLMKKERLIFQMEKR